MDEALEVDILAASLRLEGAQAAELMEHIAARLKLVLPDNVTVTRGGWFLSAQRPVTDIVIRFEDNQFQLSKDKNGPVVARQIKVVRGVALKTTEVPFDSWVAALAGEMAELAQRNAQAREAMGKLVR